MIAGSFFRAKMAVPSGWVRSAHFLGHAPVEWDRAVFVDGVALEEAALVVGNAEDPFARLESRSIGRRHGADHLVQRVTEPGIRLLDVANKVRKVRPAEAGEFGLKHDLPAAVRLRRKRRLRRVDQLDAGRPRNLGGKQARSLRCEKMPGLKRQRGLMNRPRGADTPRPPYSDHWRQFWQPAGRRRRCGVLLQP